MPDERSWGVGRAVGREAAFAANADGTDVVVCWILKFGESFRHLEKIMAYMVVVRSSSCVCAFVKRGLVLCCVIPE